MNGEKLAKYLATLEPGYTNKSRITYTCEMCGIQNHIILKCFKEKISKGSLYCKKCSLKQKWQDEEYRSKIKKSQEIIWNETDTKNKISEKSKKLWQDPEYKSAQLKIHSDPEYLKSAREHSIDNWKSVEFRENQLKTRNTPDFKAKQSQSMRDLWNSNKYVEKTLLSLSKKFSSDFKSSLEIITSNILTALSISYKEQYVVGPYIFDFYLPDFKVYIECQGEYWHSLESAVKRDASKSTYLRKAHSDSKFLYLNEVDFCNPTLIKQKIISICGSTAITQVKSFELKSVDIKLIKKDDRDFNLAHNLLTSFHYAGFGRAAKVIFGAYKDKELIAVCKFSPPIRQEVATSLGISPKNMLELDRFCIKPDRQIKNFASWFLSRAAKLIFSIDSSKSHLVSFADSTYNHLGTIYKAANWAYVGVVSPDYYYVNGQGWILHKKTLYNQAVRNKMRESDYAEKHHYVKIYGKEKYKFILAKS